MLAQIDVEPAFVLHSWPFRNTGLLLDIFTQNYGRVGVVARGVTTHRQKQLGIKALLQPFQPLLLTCQKKRGDLFVLQQVEAFARHQLLNGRALFCGLYLNELLQRLLTRFDPYPQLFSLYQQSITALADKAMPIEPILRRFEKQFLIILGYGLSFSQEAHTGVAIAAEHYYDYKDSEGYFSRVRTEDEQRMLRKPTVFCGKHLLAIANDEYTSAEVLSSAKRLLRLALSRLLGNKPLKTRQVMKDLIYSGSENFMDYCFQTKTAASVDNSAVFVRNDLQTTAHEII